MRPPRIGGLRRRRHERLQLSLPVEHMLVQFDFDIVHRRVF
jgi:hypothetical protein